MTVITIPDFCLVALVGASGSGKSTFASRHFLETEIISSDASRAVVSDDETDQSATADAFDLVHFIAEKRLARRRLVVIDATNVRPEDRKSLVQLARKHHALAIAIVINPGEKICQERNRDRPNRQFGPHVIRNQTRALKRGIRAIGREGFRYVHELRSPKDIDQAEIVRRPVWSDQRDQSGPFDIIGDVHGCADELTALLEKLGYQIAWSGDGEGDGGGDIARACTTLAPAGRRAIFVGDLVDRGPNSPDVLRIVMAMVENGQALCVPGNHDDKFLRWLKGRNVKLTHGLAETVAQLEAEPKDFRDKVKVFLDRLVSHLWLDEGRLAIAHAGIKEDLIGRASGGVRSFCLYGETTGETDEFGLPIRYNWAEEYRGATTVVYGHTPVPEAEWLNNTICIDTGCCFGGKLTALRWPERELVEVPAARTYSEPIRPLGTGLASKGGMSAQQSADDLLDISDVIGKRVIRTRLARSVSVHEAHSAAALEILSRFGLNPKWLIYLPPTMSPSETSDLPGYLEHPAKAFDYYAAQGIGDVMCQEKHMGSRAVIVLCRDRDVARSRFAVNSGETGVIYTRTGRAFFADHERTEAMLSRLRGALDEIRFWERHETDWACFDAEIMPWSAKAMSLIRDQYAATGTAARVSLSNAVMALSEASKRDIIPPDLIGSYQARLAKCDDYINAYRNYCWPARDLEDYRVAPFHLLASEGHVHMDKNHLWHMDEAEKIAATDDPIWIATNWRHVQLSEEKEREAATDWWRDFTGRGGEGMVVKPAQFIARGTKGHVQPAVKCRGQSYLRIIYGPEYDLEPNLQRLRKRGLGLKRALAMREFSLGFEALSRFVERAPLRQVHECVFAVLALESEPVDPRL